MEFNCCVFSNILHKSDTEQQFNGCTLRNCLWTKNHTPVIANSSTFENCTIVDNYKGGILMATKGYSATFINCVSAGNTGGVVGQRGNSNFSYRSDDRGQWSDTANCSLTLKNCYIEDGDEVIVTSHMGKGVDNSIYPVGSDVPLFAFDQTGKTSEIYERARQAGPGFADAENGDWHLARKSPLRDAGINADWMANATDLEGKPRLLRPNGKYSASATVDLGCYECDLPVSEGLRLFLR